MRIDNSYLSQLTSAEARANQNAGEAGHGGKPASTPPPADSTHTPSAELARLRALLQAAPNSRVDVLARVAQTLATGYYTTPEAAGRAADAILANNE